jgi:hypothetical protein
MKHVLYSLCLACIITSLAGAAQVLVSDVGGTAQMPIQAPYPSINPMVISAGLPPASQINIDAAWLAPAVSVEQAGGTLGGTQSAGGGPLMQWTMQGTGALAAYNRVLVMPASSSVASFPTPSFGLIPSTFEVHAAPRTPFAPVQSYTTDLFRMFSQIAGGGDPDFDLLRLVAGTDFGLPSPGQTKLTQVGGSWNVESFFDITYRIDFVGHPGGPFSGMSGSSTHVSRFQIGMPVPEPTSATIMMLGGIAACWTRRVH